jgi:ATP-dependent RNA helicase DHX8/PRP22
MSFWSTKTSIKTLKPHKDTMEKLQFLSLVNKVCVELENHLGIKDKTLAEFVIDLAEGCTSSRQFFDELGKNGAELPDSFVDNLFVIIQRMKPKKPEVTPVKKETTAIDGEEGLIDHRTHKYPGLALHDTKPVPILVEKQKKHGEGTKLVEMVPSPSTDAYHEEKKSHHDHDTKKRHSDRDYEDRRHDDRRRDDKYDDRRYRDDRRRDDKYDRNDRRHDKADDHRSKKRHYDEYDNEPPRKRHAKEDERRNELYINEVYKARVAGVKEYGFFAQLLETADGVRLNMSKREGLCHVSEMKDNANRNVADIVSHGQNVFVKVLGVTELRISLSMRDIDQKTGRDLNPMSKHPSSKPPKSISGYDDRNDRRDTGALPRDIVEKTLGSSDSSGRTAKRLTPHELWELTQLAKVGAIPFSDIPRYDMDNTSFNAEEELEQEIDIELNDKEAKFLEGQTSRAGVNYSPVRIVPVPDGSLQRAAERQSELAAERKEIREQQRAQSNHNSGLGADSELGSTKFLFDDPMAQQMNNANTRHTRGQENQIVPEWKKNTLSGGMGKPITGPQSIKAQRESLPIFKLKDDLVKAVQDNQILVVIGETGSGKTTQMTQYLAEGGFTEQGVIGCTQPRRVAAISVAKRVADEFGCKVGQEVGYCIRFEDCTTPDTKIKYMTDGMLLREALLDPDLPRYSVIMLDEAHERNLHTDVLFGLLKKVCQRRKDLKLIVTSATLDAEKFSSYFFNCPIFTIPGRTFPVEILYTKEPESDYLDAALITVMQIHLTEPAGDILLFLTGQEEIDTACQILFERMKQLGSDVPELIILPIYSSLPSEMQSRIFEPAPPGSRKVVIGTNIAETSITIDGIFYVVDPGFVKQNCYNAKTGVDSLMVVPISQAAGRQRAGRAGRTGPGKCYRLYTEQSFKTEMLPNTVPEIQRTNLGNTVLTLKAMGINDLLGFDFMDPPPPQTLISAMEQLYALGALDDEGLLTRLGRKMAEFPLEPQMSKTLIASVDLRCSDEVLTIVSMISIQTIFYRPREKQAQADQKKAKFHQPEGDHLTLLAAFQAWKQSNYSNAWCFENFIQARSMKRALDVRKQLLTIMDRYKLDVVSCGKNYTLIRKAITSGYFAHAARKDPQEGYRTCVENQPVYIHPGSSLFQKNPEWVLYHTLIMTTKEYMREIMTIEPKWLAELAPNFYKAADPNKLSKRKREEKIEPLFNKYAQDKDEWRISKNRR